MTKKIAEMSLEELHKRRSILKGTLIGLATIWVLMMLTFIYLKTKAGFFIQFAMPFMCMWPAISAFNKVNEELKLRGESGQL